MSELDFTFSWEGASGSPWRHLMVASFRGTEAISELYHYEIALIAREPAPEVDPDDLVGLRATLRITTHTEPRYRVIHGVIIEAEEVGPVQHGVLYRVVLAPPLMRAKHRKRCRIFLEKTTRQIIDAVLQGDPELRRDDGAVAEPDGGDDVFSPAKEVYAWRVSDPARLDDVAARAYCVQYNETDLDFVARLLEEEGIGYHFENGAGACVLVLSDRDAGRTRLDPFLPIGPDLHGRAVTSMKLGARLRPKKVSILDYNWIKPALDMTVATPAAPSAADLVEHEYPGRFVSKPELGRPIAEAKLDRLGVEASYATGEAPCRALFAGSIFALEHPLTRYDGEYLITKMTVLGESQGMLAPGARIFGRALDVPYQATIECARRGKNGAVSESRFRPARTTPKPRVQGTQTAFVTAEPSAQGAEINVGGPPGGEIGCVRLKFHWDKETARHAKEPTSCWVRVSQVFAGVGEGGVWHPRVGVEAIVDFEEGDPDRPIVVGRVYNGQNRPPGGAPTVSTMKSMTSPGGGSHNELRFDDTAGGQQILLHTPKDWNNEVGNDRAEQIANNSASNVGVDRSESTGTNRTTMVGSNNSEVIGVNESVTVGVDQTLTVGNNQALTVGVDQTLTIGANQTLTVGANQTETITGNRTITVSGNDVLNVTGTQEIAITGAQKTQYLATHQLDVTSDQKIKVGGEQTTEVSGPQGLKSASNQRFEAPAQDIEAYGTQALKSTSLTVNASSEAKITTTSLQATGSAMVQIDGAQIIIKGGQVMIQDGDISITGGKVSVKGSPIDMDGGGNVNVVAGLIKLN